MEAQRFDTFARLIARPTARRRLVFGLAVAPFAWHTAARNVEDAAAKRRRKKRKKAKKPQPNAFGCLNVGQSCQGSSSLCCSGICEGSKPKKGKKDTSVCVGHAAAGVCFPDTDTCSLGTGIRCDLENELCFCVLTTGNAGFCGDFTGDTGRLCQECARDVDCQAEFGAGAACVVLTGACTGNCPDTGRRACVPACTVAET